jgi:hypothetical protein
MCVFSLWMSGNVEFCETVVLRKAVSLAYCSGPPMAIALCYTLQLDVAFRVPRSAASGGSHMACDAFPI